MMLYGFVKRMTTTHKIDENKILPTNFHPMLMVCGNPSVMCITSHFSISTIASIYLNRMNIVVDVYFFEIRDTFGISNNTFHNLIILFSIHHFSYVKHIPIHIIFVVISSVTIAKRKTNNGINFLRMTNNDFIDLSHCG